MQKFKRKEMKKVNVLLALLIASSLFLGVNAQSKLKLAHVSSSELMKIMPGVDTVQKALESYYTQLEDEVKAMVAEYQQKVADFQDKLPTMSQSLQKVKTEEIQDLETRIRRFQADAEEDYQKKQMELYQPIKDRVEKAIAEVAKENGYSYVFDSGLGVLLYQDESDNIFELVKKKIGIK